MTALPPTERRHLGLLMAYAFVLFACGLWWGLPLGAAAAAPPNSSFTWTGDELHPSTWGQATNPRALNAWHTRYPPMHFAVLAVASLPTLAADAVELTHDTLSRYANLWLIDRAVSVGMALAILAFIYSLTHTELGHRAARWAVICRTCA